MSICTSFGHALGSSSSTNLQIHGASPGYQEGRFFSGLTLVIGVP